MQHKLSWKRIAWIAGGILLAWVVLEVILAGRGTPPVPTNDNSVTLTGGHVQGNKISSRSWSFDYTKAQLSPDGATGSVDGVKNGIILKKGKPYARVSAEHISLDTNSLNFTAIGKVHVVLINDSQHRSFDTDLMQWTNSTQLLVMNHPSYLHMSGQTLKLKNVTIDFTKDQVHLGAIAGGVEINK